MKKIDQEKLDQLLNATHWDGARVMLEEFLNNTQTDPEDPELQAAMALVYLSVMLKINEAYEQSLQTAINQIKDIRRTTTESKEQLLRDRLSYQLKSLEQ